MAIVIAGATGFIGQKLAEKLNDEGKDIYILTRRLPKRRRAGTRMHYREWDAKNSGEWTQCLKEAEAVINLCGRPVFDARWTPQVKREMEESRLLSTRALVEGLTAEKVKVPVFINASAIGYYGSPIPGKALPEETERRCPEGADAGQDYLAQLCIRWEAEAAKAMLVAGRMVMARIGIVLDASGGALGRMLPIFKLGLGGPIASGEQWFPWIHRDDLVDALLFILKHPAMHGAVNMVSPHPVRMKEFTAALGKAIGKPAAFRVPYPVLKLMMGEVADTLAGGSQVIPGKLAEKEFKFRYARLEDALTAILAAS